MDLIVTRSRIRLLSVALVASSCSLLGVARKAKKRRPPRRRRPHRPPRLLRLLRPRRPAGGSNQAPTISGTPRTSVMPGTLLLHAGRGRRERRRPDVQHYRPAGLGRVRLFDGSLARHADAGRCRHQCEYRHQRERWCGDEKLGVVQYPGGRDGHRFRYAVLDSADAKQRRQSAYQSRVLPCLLRHDSGTYPNSMTVNNPGLAVRRGPAHAGDVVLRVDRRERSGRGERPVERCIQAGALGAALVMAQPRP